MASVVQDDPRQLKQKMMEQEAMIRALIEQRDALIAAIAELTKRGDAHRGWSVALQEQTNARFGASIPSLIKEMLADSDVGMTGAELRKRIAEVAGPRKNVDSSVYTALHRLTRMGTLYRDTDTGRYRMRKR